MKTMFKMFLLVGICCLNSCAEEVKNVAISSPNKKLYVNFLLSDDGKPSYMVLKGVSIIIDTSYLGFDLKEMPSLDANFKIIKVHTNSVDETWKMPWGEQENVQNQYNELKIELQEKDSLQRKLNLVFKVYNDGIGFRYEIPSQEHLKEVIITDENTQFQLTGDHKTWWIPGDWDIYEHLYTTSKVSKIDALSKANHGSLAQTYIPENAVNTPVTMRTGDGLHISIHEAALVDYSGMTLKVDTENLLLQSELVGSERTKYKVKRTTPFTTPWRTIQITEKATELIDSKLIVNLNEPSKVDDVSWFTPMKYSGIWWEMHLGKSSWDKAAGKHGATTENAKAFIDFSAKNNIGGVLIEGWNTGWEHWIGFEDREGVFDFITPYDDYDLKEVVRYANEKGVEIIMHHETSAAIGTYDKQLDKAYKLMQDLGIHSVKSGYVGKIIPKGEYHHGQWMVNHYNNAAIKAIDYEVAVNAHEPIKATGLRRTYPNIISREGLRGQEFNAWAADGGNPPEHLPIVAFTRMLAGPIDYTPGIFNIKLTPYKDNNQVNTTISQQLALYVVLYSPIQMAADLIENYEGNPALQFIRDVGVDWKQTKVLNGEIGDFVTIAREERETGNWFLGSITDENPRELEVSLDFLQANTNYIATIYKDAENAHWNDNPTAILIETIAVTSETSLNLQLAAGGGTAISFMKK